MSSAGADDDDYEHDLYKACLSILLPVFCDRSQKGGEIKLPDYLRSDMHNK